MSTLSSSNPECSKLKTNESIITKYTPDEYNYQLVYSKVDCHETIEFDASDISNDIHIGLSKEGYTAHVDQKWEIIIGGWSGKKSGIRRGRMEIGNKWKIIVRKEHGIEAFNQFKDSDYIM